MSKIQETTHGGPIGSEQRSDNWGGARPGAGRKKGYKAKPDPAARAVAKYFRVTAHVSANLETAAALDNRIAADIVAELISKRFRCSCADCRAARRAIPKARRV